MTTTLPEPPFRVALIGAGKVGTAVSLLLKDRGHDIVAVASRSEASASRASERLAAPIHQVGSLPPCDVVLIGASDDAVPTVAGQLAATVTEGTAVIHFAGSSGIAPLGPLQDQGAAPFALHPVQACPTVDIAVRRLPGSAWGITCREEHLGWAEALVRGELAGSSVPVGENDRVVWHAAAVATSNGIAALMAAGEAILTGIGIERPQTVLGPIATGTVMNAREGGGGAATLTGPVVRGEKEAVRRHLEALDAREGELSEAYVLVSLLILRAASRAGRLDAPTALEIARILESRT